MSILCILRKVKNRFIGLQLEDREPGELWNIVKHTADKQVFKSQEECSLQMASR